MIVMMYLHILGIIESLARPVLSLPDFDQIAGIALWVMTSEEMKTKLRIRGTD